MPNQQKIEEFWRKLIKSCIELHRDFMDMDLQEQQTVKKRINDIFKMQGIAVELDSLIGVMGNLKR